MKNTKIVELVIEDDNQELAIDAISLVTAPAIEQDFVFFGKEKNNLTFAKVDEEKRMLVSPALIPNKHIFRYDPNTDSDYYVFFSKETVRRASELYLKHNNHHKATYQHQDRVSGVLTVESWIKEGEQDKSKMYGFDLPNGTWFVKMKIENDDLWAKIKEGELKGLSIEGYFTNKFEAMQNKKPSDLEILSALNEIIRESQKPKKVELGMVDDINKIYKDAQKLSAAAEGKGLNDLRKLQQKLENDFLQLSRKAEEGLELIQKAEKQLKELGVAKPKEIQRIENVLKNYENTADDYIKMLGATAI
tara:strand:+ start:4532 stop:5446 length:915 start_codon:yes stop_codon:yes gene_type:complete